MADAPAWIGAVGTVGTLTTGLVLFAGQLSDRRRRHASRVAVWTEIRQDGNGRGYRLNVRNNGEQPIYGCRLESTLALVLPARQEAAPGDIRSESADIRSDIEAHFGVIPPGEHVANVEFLRVGEVGSVDLNELVNRGLRFRVSFTDTEGRAWSRDERGRLRRTGARRARDLPRDGAKA